MRRASPPPRASTRAAPSASSCRPAPAPPWTSRSSAAATTAGPARACSRPCSRCRSARSRAVSSTASLGLLDCSNWTVNATLTTTASWPSGVYLLRVTRRDTGRNTHVLLVVRDDGRDAEVLYGIPDTSYQAYNYWGGKSLYDDKSTGVQTVAGTARAVKVSFDRPYEPPHDDILRDWYTRADYPTVSWLEKRGLRRRLHRGLRPRALRRRGARPPRLHLRRPRRVLLGRHAHRARAGARRGRRPLLHRRQRALLEGAVRAEPGVARRRTA